MMAEFPSATAPSADPVNAVQAAVTPDPIPDPPASSRPRLPSRAAVRVDRAVTELRRGRSVCVLEGAQALRISAVETALSDSEPGPLAALASLRDPAGLRLILSTERAVAGGWSTPEPAAGPLVLTLPVSLAARELATLAGIEPVEAALRSTGALRPAGVAPDPAWARDAVAARLATAAVELARLARLVPALMACRVPAGRPAPDDDLLVVSADDLQAFVRDEAPGLRRIAEAPVPLADHEDSRFVLFRESTADFEHVAIIVGNPDTTAPVPVRLHSSCLTGDLFGSLRCDCGDQLRGAIERLDAEGGGVLLYLAQEGRGIGLANKLRAYARQDAGLDTIDADRYLGFRGDERRFAIAARMLHDLGIDRVRLLTNNPRKIDALRAAGLEVVDRIAIAGLVNRFNARYLATKRERAGHWIEAEPPAGQSGE